MGIRRFALLGACALAAGVLAWVAVACVDNSNAVDPCPKYCADIAATCTGADQQYPDDQTCTRICTALNARDGGNDTIACRSLNLSSAKDETDPALKHQECVGAGVSAVNCSADQCTAYCAANLTLCGSASPYSDLKSCTDACATWDKSFTGALLGSTGDSLSCRTYHLELSQTGVAADLTTHCSHTGVTSPRCNNGSTDGGTGDAATTDSGASDATTD